MHLWQPAKKRDSDKKQPIRGTRRAGKAAAVVLLRAIQGRAAVGQADHAGQAEGTPHHVLGQTLQVGGIARRQVDAVVDAEPRMRPGAHRLHGRPVDLLGGDEQLEDFGLPRSRQQIGACLR